MLRDWLHRYLLPDAAERDPEFLQEIHRTSHISLLVIGGAEMVFALFMMLVRLLIEPNPETARIYTVQAFTIFLLGASCFVVARWKWLYPWSRFFALFYGILAAITLTWFSLRLLVFSPAADDLIPGQITLVMLVVIAAVPAKPWQILASNMALLAFYLGGAYLVVALYKVDNGPDLAIAAFIVMLSLLSTALAALMYSQRLTNYLSFQRTRQMDMRSLLSENAASLGRLSAAITHELNSPLGALISSVDTLVLVGSRQAISGPEESARLVLLQNDLRKSIRESADRLKQIVSRLQRITNLDKAEVQEVNINELINDVAALMEPDTNCKVELDLKPLDPLVCRPQQISAVLSNLLHNALTSLNGNGEISIKTRQKDHHVEIEIADNGSGVDPVELASIFEPSFKVLRNRVSSTNWSLFSSRQIVREHGGDIRISSQIGHGTQVCISLPADGMRRT